MLRKNFCLLEAVREGDLKRTRKLINAKNLVESTNLVILACKHNKVNILEYVLSSNGKFLSDFSLGPRETTILPSDEDETCYNAFYYAIRSGSVELLDTLISKWPGNYFPTHLMELDEILSRANEELKLKNVLLSEKMEIFVENKLIDLHFFFNSFEQDKNMKSNLNSIREKIELLLQNVEILSFIHRYSRDFSVYRFIRSLKAAYSTLSLIETQREDMRRWLRKDFPSDINSNTMTQGNFAEGFADLSQSVWSGNLNSIVPTNFKKLVNAYRPDFRGNDQQDSDEFLVFLLDALHEDLNKVKKKQPMKEQENEGKTQSESSHVAFINWESSNKSKISDLFYGQEMSTLTCTTCSHSSIRFDMICALVVPIPNVVYHCRLQDCLSLYTEGESIADWNCPKCRRNSKESIKKLDLIRTPKILIVTLKRFSKDFQQWHKYDDSEVSILREDDVISKEAYILFYSKLV
ncbi:hypothetical protein QYM36_008768 [Artemia franciscana]|uniref:ubiquitinyl hydrolase 1 n=1 Tax=Artemia franciscana TaxID=6661 RepID=A0AA88L645_ARTSF|nr:hypothetical protein QYM36_008768 [Artemia franciscana]